jgi:hypothetical protein
MTVNELVSHIADELNITSDESLARVTRELNKRYKQVTSAIGLIPSRREEVSKAATIGNRFIVFSGIEKVDTVYRKNNTTNILLQEITHEEMLEITPRDEPPQKYSIFSVTATTVTVWLDCTPTTTFTLYASGLADVSTLTGLSVPAFPESFHDILIYGVCADEYRRKEKADLAKESEQNFERRLSDLKMFLAKSAWLDIHRGKYTPSDGWWDTDFRKR